MSCTRNTELEKSPKRATKQTYMTDCIPGKNHYRRVFALLHEEEKGLFIRLTRAWKRETHDINRLEQTHWRRTPSVPPGDYSEGTSLYRPHRSMSPVTRREAAGGGVLCLLS